MMQFLLCPENSMSEIREWDRAGDISEIKFSALLFGEKYKLTF